jgi:hypothetical protein
MAEKITNGTFDTSLSYWYNIGAGHFVWSAGQAMARSYATSTAPLGHILTQAFSVGGSVLSAVLNVRYLWAIYSGKFGNGQVIFTVKITDPSSVTSTLATVTKGPDVDEDMLCDDLDISSYMTSIGTYILRLEATCKSGLDDEGYLRSFGLYDDISLVVTERFTKTVLEAIGGGELPTRMGVDQSDQVGLSEDLTAKQGKWATDKTGLRESLVALVHSGADESAGLKEYYSYYLGTRRSAPTEVAGLAESLHASWQSGNVTIERDIVEAGDIWTDTPNVETNWETV